jgi:hypothetical protein
MFQVGVSGTETHHKICVYIQRSLRATANQRMVLLNSIGDRQLIGKYQLTPGLDFETVTIAVSTKPGLRLSFPNFQITLAGDGARHSHPEVLQQTHIRRA